MDTIYYDSQKVIEKLGRSFQFLCNTKYFKIKNSDNYRDKNDNIILSICNVECNNGRSAILSFDDNQIKLLDECLYVNNKDKLYELFKDFRYFQNKNNSYTIFVNKIQLLFYIKDYINNMSLMETIISKEEEFKIQVDIKNISLKIDDTLHTYRIEFNDINILYNIIRSSIKPNKDNNKIYYYLGSQNRIREFYLHESKHTMQVLENCIYSENCKDLIQYKFLEKLNKKMFKFKLENDNNIDKRETDKFQFYVTYNIKDNEFNIEPILCTDKLKNDNLKISFSNKEVCEKCIEYLKKFIEEIKIYDEYSILFENN